MSSLTRQHSREQRPQHPQALSSAAAAAAAAATSAQPAQPASSDPGACPCVAGARVWLSSAANSLCLRISSTTDDELHIEVPSLSLSFSVTLGRPHGISVAEECSILESLESDSYSFLFGDDEAAANQRATATSAVRAVAGASVAADFSDHEGLSIAEILAFAHAHIQRMDRSWASPRSRGKRSRSVSGKRGGANGDVDGEGGDEDDVDNDGESDFGGEGDDYGDAEASDWGDTEEICALDEVSVEPPVTSTPSPLHAAGHGAAAASSSSSSSAAGSSSASSVTVLSKADVAALQAAMISRVAAALDVIPSSATLLLRKCRWNEDACTTRFRAEGSQFAAECGCARTLHELVAPPPDPNSNSNLSADPSTAPASFICPVCFDFEVPFDRTFALRCGHRLCLPCWCAYLRSEISGGSVSGGSALNTRCAASGCREAVGPGAVELILDHHDSAEEQAEHSDLLARYANLLALSFVDDSDALQWCPASGCEKIVRSTGKLGTVRCGCGKVFCFRCALDAHAPCSCAEAADWTARDKGSANLDTKYLIEQTKPCPNPKCGVRTKKEGQSLTDADTHARIELPESPALLDHALTFSVLLRSHFLFPCAASSGGCMFVMCSQCRCSWCWHCGQDGADHHVWGQSTRDWASRCGAALVLVASPPTAVVCLCVRSVTLSFFAQSATVHRTSPPTRRASRTAIYSTSKDSSTIARAARLR